MKRIHTLISEAQMIAIAGALLCRGNSSNIYAQTESFTVTQAPAENGTYEIEPKIP